MKKEKVICFGFPKWEGDYLKSTVQLVKKLSKNHDIVYVDYPYTFTDLVRAVFKKKVIPIHNIIGFKNRTERVRTEKNHSCLLYRMPPIIPANWIKSPLIFTLISKINGYILLYSVRKMAKKHGFTEPVVINAFNPWLGLFMKGRLNEKKLIYYCYDDISQAPWIGKHGERLEKSFLPLVDQVVVSSTKLFETKKIYNSKISLVPNGVDTRLFNKEPERIRPIHRSRIKKTIGFLGSLDLRVDLPLLLKAISKFPEYNFSFVGRVVCKETEKQLQAFPNVIIKGPKHPSMLYKEIDSMDLCIIPFKINKLTSAIYPLKINEYLLRGKPVVTTNFSNLSDFEGLIHIAVNQEHFYELLASEKVYSTSIEDILKRRHFALSNSWENRAKTFSQILIN